MSASIDRCAGARCALADTAPLDGAEVALAWARVENSGDVTRRSADARSLDDSERVREHATADRIAAELEANAEREEASGFASLAADFGDVATVAAVVGASVAVPGGGIVAVAALTSAGLGVASAVAAREGASDGVVLGLSLASAGAGLAAGGAGAVSGVAGTSGTLSGVATASQVVGGGAQVARGGAKIESGVHEARATRESGAALSRGDAADEARRFGEASLGAVRAAFEHQRAAYGLAREIADVSARGVRASITTMRG